MVIGVPGEFGVLALQLVEVLKRLEVEFVTIHSRKMAEIIVIVMVRKTMKISNA